MGYNTAMVVLNDYLHHIREDEDFGQEVSDVTLTARRLGGHGRGFSVLPSQHADTAQIVVITANSIRSLGFGHWTHTDEELLKVLADQMGYRVSKKPTKRVK